MIAKHAAPDVIFAERVGSCTDIAATTLRPLQECHESYNLAPFTVLVDPARATQLLSDEADGNLRFLFKKQLEEADIVCFSKADLSDATSERGVAAVRQLSAKTGEGVTAWLDEVLSGKLLSASRDLDLDYPRYARAEAALAWLNLTAELHPDPPATAPMLMGPLIEAIDVAFISAGISIIHLKLMMSSEAGFLKAAICRNGEEPVIEGALDAFPAASHNLLVNCRALGGPSEVRRIVEHAVRGMNAMLEHLEISCFHPAAPRPERRIDPAKSLTK